MLFKKLYLTQNFWRNQGKYWIVWDIEMTFYFDITLNLLVRISIVQYQVGGRIILSVNYSH